MINYRGFISELEPLLRQARALRDARELHDDGEFRKWRNKVTQLLSQIVQQDYLITCQIKRRSFGNVYGTIDERRASYQQEIDDTVNELDFIIDNYKTHGEPPKGGLSQEPKQLEWPVKISLAWLFKHAPWTLWTSFVGLLVGAFILGIQVAQTNLYRQVMEASQPAQTASKVEQNKLPA